MIPRPLSQFCTVLLPLGFTLVACAGTESVGPVAIQLVPGSAGTQSLVTRIGFIALRVFAGDVAECNDDGSLRSDAAPLAEVELGDVDCPGGARFCAQLELERSSVPRVFAAEGYDADGELFASACSTVNLDRSTIEVPLGFLRTLPAARCGDGRIEPPETCEGSNRGFCDASCTSLPITLSNGAPGNQTLDGEGTQKLEPGLVAHGEQLVAFYTDESSAAGDGQVALRITSNQLGTLSNPAALGASFFLPSTTLPGPVAPQRQAAPSACSSNGSLAVAFETQGADKDVALRVLGADYAVQGNELLLSGDGSAGSTGDQILPHAACATDGRVLTVWRDVPTGRVRGRMLELPATLGRIQEVGAASEGQRVAVLARPSGFVVAWEAGREIRLRVLTAEGTPSGGELRLQGEAVRSAPSLAALADGRFALAFAEGEGDASRVYIARFSSDAGQLEAAQLADENPRGSFPALVALPAVGGSYALLWSGSGGVRARYFGGERGALLNPIDGTEAAFTVAESPARTPAGAVAAGALNVVWQQNQDDGGVRARSLPLPSR